MINKTNATPENISLRAGSFVPASFFYDLQKCVAEKIQKMDPSHVMTLSEICGEVLWGCFLNGGGNFVGKCIATMVERGELELIAVGKNSSNHRLYCRKQTEI